jgi:hypothetical protein
MVILWARRVKNGWDFEPPALNGKMPVISAGRYGEWYTVVDEADESRPEKKRGPKGGIKHTPRVAIPAKASR